MKSVLISIQPKWCELIASGNKTIEVRKTRPKIDTPFRCFIYCTKNGNDRNPNKNLWKTDLTGFNWLGNGKVIGEFICDNIIEWTDDMCPPVPLSQIQLSYSEIRDYGKDKNLYLWHISDLKIYDKPQALNEFNINRAPQSWCYVESKDGEQK